MTVIVYHNPRCSKSRATLALLKDYGIEPDIIEYLQTPQNADTLLEIAKKLNQPLQALLRAHDSEDDVSGLDDAGLAQYLIENPKLIQRPIVVVDDRARIGRPPESILEILP
ncbi:MAG: arsenate reductase (glutaredoxin) [Pseudomonadota bacterium]